MSEGELERVLCADGYSEEEILGRARVVPAGISCSRTIHQQKQPFSTWPDVTTLTGGPGTSWRISRMDGLRALNMQEEWSVSDPLTL